MELNKDLERYDKLPRTTESVPGTVSPLIQDKQAYLTWERS